VRVLDWQIPVDSKFGAAPLLPSTAATPTTAPSGDIEVWKRR
jgi:hypothetical protein